MNIKLYPSGYSDISGEWISDFSRRTGSFQDFKFVLNKHKNKYSLTITLFEEIVLKETNIKTIKKSKEIIKFFINNFSNQQLKNVLKKYYGQNKIIQFYKKGESYPFLTTWKHSLLKMENLLPYGTYFYVENDKVWKLFKGSAISHSSSSLLELTLC